MLAAVQRLLANTITIPAQTTGPSTSGSHTRSFPDRLHRGSSHHGRENQGDAAQKQPHQRDHEGGGDVFVSGNERRTSIRVRQRQPRRPPASLRPRRRRPCQCTPSAKIAPKINTSVRAVITKLSTASFLVRPGPSTGTRAAKVAAEANIIPKPNQTWHPHRHVAWKVYMKVTQIGMMFMRMPKSVQA